jgi:hypothetical protein
MMSRDAVSARHVRWLGSERIAWCRVVSVLSGTSRARLGHANAGICRIVQVPRAGGCDGVMVAGYGLAGSYVSISELADRHGVPLAELVPADSDGGLVAEIGTATPMVVRDSETDTESGDESDGETADVITLAGISTHSEAAGRLTVQEVMWACFQREHALGRTRPGPNWIGSPTRTTSAAPCCGSGVTRDASRPAIRISARWCGMTAQLSAVRPGPADVTHPRRSLARLALSSTYLEAADFATGGVATVSDEFGDAYDCVDHAARLVSMAQDVLVRAVVYARERGGRWDDIAEALNLTAEQTRDQYTRAIEQWKDTLNRPWERSGWLLISRMPDGTTEPNEAGADLDQWCLRHLEDNDGGRHNARRAGTEDRMVSANLSEHTPLTEMNSLTRTAAYLIQRGTKATVTERDAYASRKKILITRLSRVET